MRRLIAVLVLAVGIVSQVNAQTGDPPAEGVDAEDRKKFEAVKARAESGDALNQGKLGFYYYNGIRVPEDKFLGLYWYRRAAEQGDFTSQRVLGEFYEHGKGVPRDIQKALYWYRLASHPRDLTGAFEATSAYRLGVINLEGKEIQRDVSAAYWWFRRAAEGFHYHAQYALGQMYENGEGVRKDFDAAIHWYREAIRWSREVAGEEHEGAREALERLGK